MICMVNLTRTINPEMPVVTAGTSRSGAFDRAAVNASSGLVKNSAENPLICNMVARVDAMQVRRPRRKSVELGRETHRASSVYFSVSYRGARHGSRAGAFKNS
jgi:hypothetical protein